MKKLNYLVLAGILISGGSANMAWAENIKIYAAASLTNAITDIAKQYEQQNPDTRITPVFAASSTLAKQIAAGAPADIFFSADEKWMKYLVDKNKVDGAQVNKLLGNQLVVISPKGHIFIYKPDAKYNFAKAFKGYVCTGQMESVPVGIYAKQSLTNLGWYDALKGRIVGAEDVRSALAFVERGECAAGIVYATDAKISKKVQVLGALPDNSHQPIIYPVAPTRQANSNLEAQKVLQYIETSPQARAIFVQYGFNIQPK